jgi:hypothetical protein
LLGGLGAASQGGLGGFNQFFGIGAGQGTPEQQAIGGSLQRLLQFGSGNPFAQAEQLLRPSFQQNLTDIGATIREQGPRFASQTQQAIGQAGNRALSQHQALLGQIGGNFRQQNIQSLLAAGQLGLGSQQLGTQAFQPFLQAGQQFGFPGGFIQQQSPLGGFFGGALQGAGLGLGIGDLLQQQQQPQTTPTQGNVPGLPPQFFGPFSGF